MYQMEFFHTLNRGVDKRQIFMDEKDYFRFVHDLYEFNDKNWVNNTGLRFNQTIDIASRYMNRYVKKERKLLVDIHAFCLMPNHYHLLLTPRMENGIPTFMKKLNMGYAKYFNEKYKRIGALFQGRYKSVMVTKETHFMYLPYYIHCNPLDLITPEWREKELRNYQKAINFLESYRWSSHLDYSGGKSFPSVTKREFLLKAYDGPKGYKKLFYDWLKELDLKTLGNNLLE